MDRLRTRRRGAAVALVWLAGGAGVALGQQGTRACITLPPDAIEAATVPVIGWYLCHSFYSPLSNTREDEYGGTFENRIRFTLQMARSIRRVWPDEPPFSVRLSCTDWVDGGWTLEDSVALARALKAEGVDIVDCSSGGNVLAAIPLGAGYQVPFAETVRREAGVATAAVGLITEPTHADEIVRNGRADIVLLAREELRDPYW